MDKATADLVATATAIDIVALELEGMKPASEELQNIRKMYLALNEEKKSIEAKLDILKAQARKIFEVEGVEDFVDPDTGNKIIGEFESTSVSVNTKAMKVAHPILYKKYVTEKPKKTFYCRK